MSQICQIPINIIDAMLILTNTIETTILELQNNNNDNNNAKYNKILYANNMIKLSLIRSKVQ